MCFYAAKIGKIIEKLVAVCFFLAIFAFQTFFSASTNPNNNNNSMKDFNFYAPTEVVFGKQSEEQVAQLVKRYGGKKVLIHYGGQSAKRSGLLDKMEALLKEAGIPYVMLGGVVANARLSLV